MYTLSVCEPILQNGPHIHRERKTRQLKFNIESLIRGRYAAKGQNTSYVSHMQTQRIIIVI